MMATSRPNYGQNEEHTNHESFYAGKNSTHDPHERPIETNTAKESAPYLGVLYNSASHFNSLDFSLNLVLPTQLDIVKPFPANLQV